jgi:N-acetylglucosaminyl-diphospho-decaprenol L-rhamnosyltransferase
MSAAHPVIEASIVIVNWNVRDLLRQCLQSVYDAGGLRAEQLQVIVVDNASADGSVEMVRAEFPQVELVANADNLGFGKANNQALPMCRGRHVVLLNPDTKVLDRAIARMAEMMDAEPEIAVLGCRLLNGDGTLQRWTGGAYPRLANLLNHYFFLDRLLPSSMRPMPLYLDHDVNRDIEVDWLCGACMVMRTAELDGKLFNPDYFMYGEDMELCHRLKQAGGKVVYTPRVSIIHYQGESMKQQQEGDVLLSALKGPRQFYRQMRGGRGLWLYDLVTVAGFGLRWSLYQLGALLPRAGADSLQAKARSSHDLMNRAWRIMRA